MFSELNDLILNIDWSSTITATATVVLAILTFIYVRITGKILSSQSDPCVIITVVHDDDRPTIIQLHVKNIGSGLARDIRFEFNRPIPAKAFGLSVDEAKKAEDMKSGPLIDGIPALGPYESRKIDWGQYGGLVASLGDEPIIATCRFKKNGKEMPPINCPLEVKSFKGTVANKSTNAKIANELEKMSKNIQHLVTGFKKLKVDVVSLPTEDKDNEENT